MLKLNFINRGQTGCKILCLGAHSDDIEIGCGGTILRFTEENKGNRDTMDSFFSTRTKGS